MRRYRKWLAYGIGGCVLLTLATVTVGLVWVHRVVQANLPQLEGERRVPQLSRPVTIERDAAGIPRIVGENRIDVAFATGFVHGQDRFFQMDLLRRNAAGELAELVGSAAVEMDKSRRLHRFRWRAEEAVKSFCPFDRQLLEAYAAGVNEALQAAQPPFEYTVLRQSPRPWRSADTLLVVFSMYLDLQSITVEREADLALLHDAVPPAAFEFLAPRGTEFDAPLDGGSFPAPPLPGPEVIDFRTQKPSVASSAVPFEVEPAIPGSNNWAVHGKLTRHGAALVANDMHLGHAMPGIWYRAQLVWKTAQGEARQVTGVTLPGAPNVVVGSSGRIAWAFTNSMIDVADLIVLETDPDRPGMYRTKEGPKPIETVIETIAVAGGPSVEHKVRTTVWGPILKKGPKGKEWVLRWSAHDLEAINLNLVRLEEAANVEEALDTANSCGIPAQNFVVGDTEGNIGWTIMGRVPNRVGYDGRLPRSWADGTCRWEGYLEPRQAPRVVNPPAGRIWTANARVVSNDAYHLLGDGGYDLSARNRQIRDRLLALEKASEADMLAIQLDDEAVFLARWQELLAKTLSAAGGFDGRDAMQKHVAEWGGRASIDSIGYRLVRAFRARVWELALEPVVERCRKLDPGFRFRGFGQSESAVWTLVQAQPLHWLNPRFSSWRELFESAAKDVYRQLTKDGRRLERQTWGEANRVAFRHPLSGAIPLAGNWLDIAAEPLPGDNHMPRVQSVRFGASERMAVSPGHEAEGYLHMPGGQSGNPLSPHYRDAHPAWARGKPAPFLPGEAKHRLVLTPGS